MIVRTLGRYGFVLTAIALHVHGSLTWAQYLGRSAEADPIRAKAEVAPLPIPVDPELRRDSVAGRQDQESYVLGPGDQIRVWARDSEEISAAPYRLDEDGAVRLPLLGRVKLAGLNVAQAEKRLLQLMQPYFVEPDVTVSVSEYRSQSISILGAVNSPGVLKAEGPTSIVEAISLVGGLRDNAGYTATLLRDAEHGDIPVESAQVDGSGRYRVAQIPLDQILDGKNPEFNILLRPNDTLTVDEADLVYVLGEVNRAGGFALKMGQSISVTKALAMAQGWTSSAAPKNAFILRPVPEGGHREIKINLRKVMSGESNDLAMASDDILYVPASGGKRLTRTVLTAGLAVATSVTIWRLGRN